MPFSAGFPKVRSIHSYVNGASLSRWNLPGVLHHPALPRPLTNLQRMVNGPFGHKDVIMPPQKIITPFLPRAQEMAVAVRLSFRKQVDSISLWLSAIKPAAAPGHPLSDVHTVLPHGPAQLL